MNIEQSLMNIHKVLPTLLLKLITYVYVYTFDTASYLHDVAVAASCS